MAKPGLGDGRAETEHQYSCSTSECRFNVEVFQAVDAYGVQSATTSATKNGCVGSSRRSLEIDSSSGMMDSICINVAFTPIEILIVVAIIGIW